MADRALEAVSQIADDLQSEERVSWSLADGNAGIALFLAYYARAVPDSDRLASARLRLHRAIEAVAQTPMSAGLYSGFSGVAWVAEHLSAEEDDLNASIDEALETGFREASNDTTWWQYFELIEGLAGLGVYAMERMPRTGAERLIESIVGLLNESSERTPDGITWRTRPDELSKRARRSYPDGYYNLGVAHGIPGVIGFLAGACALGVNRSLTGALLDGAVRWLLAQSLPPGGAAEFPRWISSSDRPAPDRASWCYGNPGIAATLLAAARAVDGAWWERDALTLARACAARGVEAPRVSESCLCHGSAGNAHLFNRLFQATGDEQFRDAALRWLERTLALRDPGPGPAGFQSRVFDDEDRESWVRQPGFLMGISGVGLALLAATNPVEPAWDRVLLASLPVRR